MIAVLPRFMLGSIILGQVSERPPEITLESTIITTAREKTPKKQRSETLLSQQNSNQSNEARDSKSIALIP